MGDEQEYVYNCSVCKAEVDAHAEICPQCGADLSETEHITNPSSVVKVGGWLLFFCIILTIITPIFSFSTIIYVLVKMPLLIKYAPDFALWEKIDLVMMVGIISFSIYAGISLWKKKSGAVDLAKKYLIAFFIYSLVEAVIVLSYTKADVGMNLLRSFVFVGIWYTYLTKSKRVKDTYSLGTADSYGGENKYTSEIDKKNIKGNEAEEESTGNDMS